MISGVLFQPLAVCDSVVFHIFNYCLLFDLKSKWELKLAGMENGELLPCMEVQDSLSVFVMRLRWQGINKKEKHKTNKKKAEIMENAYSSE